MLFPSLHPSLSFLPRKLLLSNKDLHKKYDISEKKKRQRSAKLAKLRNKALYPITCKIQLKAPPHVLGVVEDINKII